MTCLKDETLAALARGVIPQGELGRIREHLPECPRCLDALARRSRSRPGGLGDVGDERRTEAPTARQVPPSPKASGRFRWIAVVAAGLTVVLCGLWVAPAGRSVRAGAEGAWTRVASAARGAAVGTEARQAWRALRGLVETPSLPGASAAPEGVAPPEGAAANAASPTPEPLLREEAAASARIAEASRLVERSNAAAAPNHAAGGP